MVDIDEMKKVPGSESVERPWASNDKVQFDNTITHCKTLMGYSELALKQAVEFQQKSNDAFLTERDRREQQRLSHEDASEKQRVEHENELETQRQENNRYTLDRLYSVFPEEAAGLVPILERLLGSLKQKAEEKKEEK